MMIKKMRYSVIIPLIITVILLAFIINATMEFKKESDLKQSEIDGLKKQNAKERDSLNTQLAITRDSLEVAFQTIRVAHQESVEARQRSQKTIENLKRIIFITHTDSSRTVELKALYKSYIP